MDTSSVMPSLVAMATLSAAVDVVQSMSARRLGIDPASQEKPDIARRFVRTAMDEIEEYLVALRAAGAIADRAGSPEHARLARKANALMLLNRLARVLNLVHQRLMSLYPEVSEEEVEESRQLARDCSNLLDKDDFDAALIVERAYRFCTSLRAAFLRTRQPQT